MGETIRLKEWRESRLLSQRELAKRAGVAVSTVNDVEGHRREPSWKTLRKLGKTF